MARLIRQHVRYVLLIVGLVGAGLVFVPDLVFSQAASLQMSTPSIQENVHLNQVGFYPRGAKGAVVTGAARSTPFYVMTPDRADTLLTGTLGPSHFAPQADMNARFADFSGLQKQGEYVVEVSGVGTSSSFSVEPRVHRRVVQSALKGFYFQRASTTLSQTHAGPWHRAAGHPDTTVQVHPSAASESRPVNTRLSAPKGWYDAGDYNKYIVNSGISTSTLLSFYEDFPAFASRLGIAIPERGNARADVLDEALWNLEWMLDMQDPNDGGVYHKLTAPNFEGMNVRPAEADSPRFVVQKSTAATLNFAAVMAQAARIFRDLEEPAPIPQDSLVTAAREAWEWARQYPDSLYNQDRLNERFDPDILTGAYGDDDLQDEFLWAASELYATTGEAHFLRDVDLNLASPAPVPNWSQVQTLGYYTLLRMDQEDTHEDPPVQDLFSQVQERVLARADSLAQGADTTAFRTPMGRTSDDFEWGSNSVAANQGILLVWAYQMTGEQSYLNGALANLDYLLGRNATGYSFVTGMGSRSPQNPHHRPSVSDVVDRPVPGLLVGGPNPGQQDGCEYPSDAPARSYVDATCSYASNEIAINWNAPLVYLAGAIEALQYDGDFVLEDR